MVWFINQVMLKPVIAIDGPAASGKGTLARKLAQKMNYAHLDTGAIYRIAALYLVQHNLELTLENGIRAARHIQENLDLASLQNPALRTDEIGSLTSKLSALPEIRSILLDTQRHFAQNPPDGFDGAVLDGRDIGTVVCPEADLKLYVTANVEARAQRRLKELHSRGLEADYEHVLQDMKDRDFRDMNREIAPLKPAQDSVLIDTTNLGPEEALQKVLVMVKSQLP